ncbi:MAG: M23 family metallopeptidase [Chitinispirillaceae bacterium]
MILKKNIRIQVLDVRSGQPVVRSAIKRLIISSENKTIVDESFKRGAKDSAPIQKEGDFWYLGGEKLEGHGHAGQLALAALGYDPTKPYGNTYFKNGSAAYNRYWEDKGDEETRIESGKIPPTDKVDMIIKEYNALPRVQFGATDENGTLLLSLPISKMSKGMEITIGFHDFAIAKEALLNDTNSSNPIFRSSNASQATGFYLQWRGSQSIKWDEDFGWHVKKSTDSSGSQKLRTAQTFSIPAPEDGMFRSFIDLQKSKKCFSRFYPDREEESVEEPHFVVFALQWCQPTWDNIDDNSSGLTSSISDKSIIKDGAHAHKHMHVVTTYNGAGRNYGIFATPPNAYRRYSDGSQRPHYAIDLHTELGSPMFAVHSGLLKGYSGSGWGNNARLTWYMPDDSRKWWTLYAHLDSVADQRHCMAGQIVGLAGRTDIPAYAPSHCHVLTIHGPSVSSSYRVNPKELHDNVDVHNRMVIQTNSLPLVFPCVSTHQGSYSSIGNCKMANKSIVNECWAVKELSCPFLHKTEEEFRYKRIQAQLKYLHLENPESYCSPGSIDGILGDFVRGGAVTVSLGGKLKHLGPSNASGSFRKIKVGEVSGWITVSELTEIRSSYDSKEAQYSLKTQKELNSEKEKVTLFLLPGTSGDSPGTGDTPNISNTRRAIYRFREKNPSLLKGGDESLVKGENFEIDDEFITKLDSLAPLKKKE